MWQIFLGSIVLGLIHPMFPNHWIPVIAIARSEKWSNRETVYATLITGFSHTLSTILIGIIVGFVGIKLNETYSYITHIAAPVILVLLGLVYLLLDLRSTHHHHHHFDIDRKPLKSKKSRTAIITSLCLGMFLSPCIEIEAYYFQAASKGWAGILLVSTVYLIMTLLMMTLLVYFGMKGMNRLNSPFMEKHEKRITGTVLVLLGLLAYFVEF